MGQHVARAHAAQVVHQPDDVAIADRQHVAVRHRHGEAGAAQQVAGGAHVDLGMDMLAGPIALGGEQRGLEAGQAARAGKGRQHQPVGPQHASHQDQRAGQVVDAVERAAGQHQVETGVGKGQGVFVGLHAASLSRRQEGGIDGGDALAHPFQRGAGAIVGAPDQQRFGQVPLHVAQPLQQFVQHRPVQEIMRRKTGQHPVAPARAQRSVENVGAGVHGGPCACAAKREQGR